jgi:hypothetical protein
MARILKNGFWLICLVSITITAVTVLTCLRNQRSKAIQLKLAMVQIGMTKFEVRSLVGEPENIKELLIDGEKKELWIFPHSQVASTFPQCLFDKATERVESVVIDDNTVLK